jgi:Mg/Co/Ni transporter MgtE
MPKNGSRRSSSSQRGEAEDFFLDLPARDQAELLMSMSPAQRRSWMRLLPPDDAADAIQAADEAGRDRCSICSTGRPAPKSRRCSPMPRTMPAAS